MQHQCKIEIVQHAAVYRERTQATQIQTLVCCATVRAPCFVVMAALQPITCAALENLGGACQKGNGSAQNAPLEAEVSTAAL